MSVIRVALITGDNPELSLMKFIARSQNDNPTPEDSELKLSKLSGLQN